MIFFEDGLQEPNRQRVAFKVAGADGATRVFPAKGNY